MVHTVCCWWYILNNYVQCDVNLSHIVLGCTHRKSVKWLPLSTTPCKHYLFDILTYWKHCCAPCVKMCQNIPMCCVNVLQVCTYNTIFQSIVDALCCMKYIYIYRGVVGSSPIRDVLFFTSMNFDCSKNYCSWLKWVLLPAHGWQFVC